MPNCLPIIQNSKGCVLKLRQPFKDKLTDDFLLIFTLDKMKWEELRTNGKWDYARAKYDVQDSCLSCRHNNTFLPFIESLKLKRLPFFRNAPIFTTIYNTCLRRNIDFTNRLPFFPFLIKFSWDKKKFTIGTDIGISVVHEHHAAKAARIPPL